jgi:acyl carrier protein
MDETYGQLTDLFIDFFDDDDLVATPQMTAGDVDGWDSLAHVSLVLAIEKKFKIRFAASEIAAFKTVGDMVSCIDSKLSERS